jgi:two-component system, LytTR family, sensor kinase
MKLIPARVRNLSFWHYQIIGWILYSGMQLTLVVTWKGYNWQTFLSVSIQLVVLFILLLILRKYYRTIQLHSISLFELVSRIVVTSLIMSCICVCFWGGIEYLLFGEKFIHYANSLLHILDRISVSFPIFLGWSALFFGIKLWRDWLDEREQTERATEAAQQSQLQMLRYQLNPHFLFNALNSVRALIDEDAHSAKTMITDLSEFLRYSLISRKEPIVTLKEELDAIRLYLSIEEQRYEEKLQITYDINPYTETVPVHSFLIHPLVENALQCIMQSSSMPLQLTIRTDIINGKLIVTIIHSGCQIPIQENGSSDLHKSGFKQVEARLKDLFPSRYHLSSYQLNDKAQIILELTVIDGVMHEK